MRSLKPPNMPLPLWILSPLEDHNDEICPKTLVSITYNTIKGLKMNQDRSHKGYSETESNIVVFKSVFSDKKRNLLNEYNFNKLFCLFLLIKGINLQLQC